MELTKITNQELAEVTRIRDLYTEAQMAFGNLYLQRRTLDANEKTLNDAYAKLQDDEQKLLNSIIAKYGEGNLDPKSGVFTPSVKS